jgi:creatinine amidohydrolase
MNNEQWKMENSLLFVCASLLIAEQGMKGIYLENLTWPEAEAAFKRFTIAVLPIGARTKEHGHHLPLKNDFVIAEYLARRVTELCSVVTLPTIPYGYYPAFVEYPGSVNIRKDVFRDLICDICRSLAAHGLKKIYALNTGISTNAPLVLAREILASENIVFAYTDLTSTLIDLKKSLLTQAAGTHADELETSMMLYLAPEIVMLERATPDVHPDRGPGGLTRNPAATTGVYSPTGAWGDPTRASREKGATYIEALVQELTGAINAL